MAGFIKSDGLGFAGELVGIGGLMVVETGFEEVATLAMLIAVVSKLFWEDFFVNTLFFWAVGAVLLLRAGAAEGLGCTLALELTFWLLPLLIVKSTGCVAAMAAFLPATDDSLYELVWSWDICCSDVRPLYFYF